MNYGLTKTRARLAGSAAILALSAGAAMAQEGVESVVVSSSRLQAAGFNAPTPTTVVSAADLEASAKPNIFNAITELPALQGSTGVSYNTGSTTTGLIGLSALGMRGLSPLRTLVLLDGQRVVGGNFNGAVDVSQMPQMLIQRVDVVTGGASASWGSDAVAGVINFVTDKKFEGFKMNASAGLSTYGDMGQTLMQMAAGTSFLGGRAHFSVAAEYSYSDGLLPRFPQAQQHSANAVNIGGRNLGRISGQASYANDSVTPAGQPRTSYYNIVQSTQSFAYSGITNGPKRFQTFTAQGQPYQLDLAGACYVTPTGTLVNAINNTCIGTPQDPGDQNSTRQFTQGLVDPITRGDIYMRLSYDLTPTTEIFATLNYGISRTQNTPAQGNSSKTGMTMRCDNAYLPATGLFDNDIRGVGFQAPITAGSGISQTQANCLTFYPTNAIQYASDWANIPLAQQMFLLRTQRRYVVGGNGTFDLFGKTWSWDSYFQHGEGSTSIKIYNMPLSGAPLVGGTGATTAGGAGSQNGNFSRFNLAQDAIVNSQGNIVCRNTVAQQHGCVPFNPFGGDNLSNGQIAYFDNQNGPGGTTLGPTAIMTQRQEAFSFAVNGSPIELWAGPVAVAAGYEYREEYFTERVDPYSGGITASTPATVNEPCTDPFIDCGLTTNGALGAWNAGNYQNGRGIYHVNEVFMEVGIPLLDDAFFGKIDLTLAGRHARYSQADKGANTWKVGITWDTPIPGIRVRALQSRDIRAPNLSELFAPPQGLNGGVDNLFTGVTGQQVRQLNEGNTFLQSEKSQTTEVGIVWQPDFIPGFQASVDYYRIGIRGVIQALGLQQVMLLCYNAVVAGGTSVYCNQDAITTANGQNISFANPGSPPRGVAGTVPSQLTAVHSKAFNASTLVVEGFDIEASYQFDLQDYDIPGQFTFRSLAGNISKFISDSGIPGTQRNTELAGVLGGGGNSQTYNQSGGNTLTWKLQETQSYQNDVWGITVTERWYAGGRFTNKNTLVCAPGTCPAPTTQTPTINFNKVSSILYLDVGLNWNVSDKTQLYTKVDNVTNIRPPDTGGQNPNNTLYDVIGRMYRVGVRFSN